MDFAGVIVGFHQNRHTVLWPGLVLAESEENAEIQLNALADMICPREDGWVTKVYVSNQLFSDMIHQARSEALVVGSAPSRPVPVPSEN